MNYILEIRNPEQIEMNRFYTMVKRYMDAMIQRNDPVLVEVFQTMNERFQILSKRERISMMDSDRTHPVAYQLMDTNIEQDYFYVSVDIANAEAEFFHQGRGALIPRFFNSTIKEFQKPFYWLDQPALASVFPVYTLDDMTRDNNGFFWFNDKKPNFRKPTPENPQFVLTMDYVQKGGQ